MKKIKNRYDAESAFCTLFVEAGHSLGVPPYGEKASVNEPHQLTGNIVSAIHQCEFDDPHFIGGPGAFNFAKTTEQVNRIFERADPIVTELASALEQVSPDQANKFRSDMQTIKDWMSRNC